MTQANFKLSTLTSIALLTFSLNVSAGGVCIPNEEEFQPENLTPEETFKNIDYDNFPQTNEEYSDIVSDNIDTVTSSSVESDIPSITGEIADTSAAITETTEAITLTIETAASALGAVIGAIGIGVTIGVTIWQMVKVFSNPNSTDLDKATASLSWNPLYGTILSIINKHKHFVALNKKIDALNHLDHYKVAALEEEIQEEILEKARPILQQGVIKDVAAVKKIKIEADKKLSKYHQAEYLHHVGMLQIHLKQFFAHKWIKASPIFKDLISFIDKTNNSSKKAVDAVVQDDQWHLLTEDGRVDSTSIVGLDKFTYTSSTGDEVTLLNANNPAVKSIALDNTWVIGGVTNPEGDLVEAARYFVITLRDTPNQDKGVEYQAYSIFSSNNFTTLIADLLTTDNFVNAGWNMTTTDYIAAGLEIGLIRANVPIPSIISQQTIALCGISNHTINFLKGKKVERIDECLDSIVWDYKNYFAAYDLDQTIQIDTRHDKIVDTTLQAFLQAYGQSFNHLVAQTKISAVNKFIKAKAPLNMKSCQLYYNNAKQFLTSVESKMSIAAKAAWQVKNNLNEKGQKMDADCWKEECTKWSSGSGVKFSQSKCVGGWVTIYECSIATYTPTKDTVLERAKNIIHQQVADEQQDCLNQKDDASALFAKRLTAQGYFYLDASDSKVLFEKVFEGIRATLIKHFLHDVKISRLSKAQDAQ